jgi:hypothetical protein
MSSKSSTHSSGDSKMPKIVPVSKAEATQNNLVSYIAVKPLCTQYFDDSVLTLNACFCLHSILDLYIEHACTQV